jgi:hypothetical protein
MYNQICMLWLEYFCLFKLIITYYVGFDSREDIEWLNSLPCTITLEDFNAIVVHAGDYASYNSNIDSINSF